MSAHTRLFGNLSGLTIATRHGIKYQQASCCLIFGLIWASPAVLSARELVPEQFSNGPPNSQDYVSALIHMPGWWINLLCLLAFGALAYQYHRFQRNGGLGPIEATRPEETKDVRSPAPQNMIYGSGDAQRGTIAPNGRSAGSALITDSSPPPGKPTTSDGLLAGKPTEAVAKTNSRSPTTAARSSPDDLFVRQVCKTIQARLGDEQFGARQLGRAFQLSDSKLYRRLRGLMGISPARLIRKMRMEEARRLLETTTLNVSQIAYQTGFSDPNYFSRAFRKTYGVPPSLIRK